MTSLNYLSRGIDYLGDLGAKLRDLQGYRTLAHELIQNADDAVNATSMAFRVSEDALSVDNDGVFSDCRQVEEPECPWKEDESRQHRCDFHRFRRIASGDKRGESGTTGAFGVGFIAVYQITDRPELISAGRHWILHEDSPENERIEVCKGCSSCLADDLPGTRFILPWAKDPDSKLRKVLRAEAVTAETPKLMVDELAKSIPVAMLFLKRLRTIEICFEGRLVNRFERLDEGSSLILSSGDPLNDRVWHVIRGGFEEVADSLRQMHPGRIEPTRSSLVTIAIPTSAEEAAVLCACLPTEHDLGLPFHINADFFTTNDRKGVIFAADYQSEWNREALRAAARAVGSGTASLPSALGAKHFWRLLERLNEAGVSSQKAAGEPILEEFWNEVVKWLPTSPVIMTTAGNWAIPASTSLLSQKEEAEAIDVLESIGLKIVDEQLRPYQSLLRSEAVGVPLLDVERICQALTELGLDKRTDLAALPSGLNSAAALRSLWKELTILLERQQRTPRTRAEHERRLREVALAPAEDGALWPFSEVYAAEDETVMLFEPLGLGLSFIKDDAAFEPLAYLCQSYDASAAIEALSGRSSQELEQLWEKGELPLNEIFEWFAYRREDILSNPDLRMKLGALPLFPSSGHLRTLPELALPGGFRDPIGLAELVDLDVLGGRRELLKDLGMPELDFETYATTHLTNALARDDVPVEKRQQATLLLAGRLGELKDIDETQPALAGTQLVECTDGVFRQAQGCHFDSPSVRDCLGGRAHIAVVHESHQEAVRDLYEWLGVAYEPRFEEIVAEVEELTREPYSNVNAARIKAIVAHLGSRVVVGEEAPELAQLRSSKWLPARGRGDRWYAPTELYATYQDYLFESQGVFVDLPVAVQNSSRHLFDLLGVHLKPPVILVVKHLLHCATRQLPVNNQVYRSLNDDLQDPAVLQLRGARCLFIEGRYYAANEVFWQDHAFGRYRRRLGEDLRSYGKLLERLGVRDAPVWEDAKDVLLEISKEFASGSRRLDDEAHAVLMACWRMIGQALDQNEAATQALRELESVKCVPNQRRILNPPMWMFFENRAGLAAKFGEILANNVIPRPVGIGGAFEEAGVRALGSAVRVELLECVDPAEDTAMSRLVLSRRNQIARVLETEHMGRDTVKILDRLSEIRCQRAVSMTVRYKLEVFGREIPPSNPEEVPAVFQAELDTLLLTRSNGEPSWAALSRELAIALLPDEDPGRFAAGLKEALSARSPEEAARTLDDLGFPRLDTEIATPPSVETAAKMLGSESQPKPDTGPTPVLEPPAEEGERLTPEQAVTSLLGPDAPSPTPPIKSPGTEAAVGGSGREDPKHPRKYTKKGRQVLRSYVTGPGEEDSGSGLDWKLESDRRSSVDKAGIRHVLEFEQASGRTAKEMPHENQGYDVESSDSNGQVVRYIEVKSLSGRWSDAYAVLSRAQFEGAMDLGDLFWLYVVERAECEDFQIHRIKNPALSANHFMFDDGWRATAEAETDSDGGD